MYKTQSVKENTSQRTRGFYWKWEFLRRNPQFQSECRELLLLLKRNQIPCTLKSAMRNRSWPPDVGSRYFKMRSEWSFPYFISPAKSLKKEECKQLAATSWPHNHPTLGRPVQFYGPQTHKEFYQHCKQWLDCNAYADWAVYAEFDLRENMKGIGKEVERVLRNYQKQYFSHCPPLKLQSDETYRNYCFVWDHRDNKSVIRNYIKKSHPESTADDVKKFLKRWLDCAEELIGVGANVHKGLYRRLPPASAYFPNLLPKPKSLNRH